MELERKLQVLTLIEFLLARVAEDEEWAAEGDNPMTGLWDILMTMSDQGPAEPLRVVAECKAKRRLVDLNTYAKGGERFTYGPDSTEVLSVLALPYCSHPDWREEWRP